MLSKSMQETLNKQVLMEAESSQAYLAIASYADIHTGLQGVNEFFFKQSDEERIHMLKLIRFINERGGFAMIPALEQPMVTFQSLRRVFDEFLKHELKVSDSINDLVHQSLTEKDYATHNFLQWRSEEHTSELQSQSNLVCRLLLEKK